MAWLDGLLLHSLKTEGSGRWLLFLLINRVRLPLSVHPAQDCGLVVEDGQLARRGVGGGCCGRRASSTTKSCVSFSPFSHCRAAEDNLVCIVPPGNPALERWHGAEAGATPLPIVGIDILCLSMMPNLITSRLFRGSCGGYNSRLSSKGTRLNPTKHG